MRELTLVMPHFCNLGQLAEHQRVWMAYPSAVRSLLHVVVVDDCSPKGQRPTSRKIGAAVSGLASFRIYRLLEKKRWNWLACRNLGMLKATTDWALMTDMDHVLPLETLVRILSGQLDARNVYRFSRVDAPHRWPYALSDCAPYKFHPDTYLMTTDTFEKSGGYDETLSGLYGTSGEFRDRVLMVANAHVRLEDVMVRYPREIIPDASTPPSVYTRKGDPENDQELIRRRAVRALNPNWRPVRGLIPYEEVYSSLTAGVEALCS